MLASLSAGIVLGLSAGFSPGPLMALVISQTLRHGIREGAKVAAAPLITDLPIILVSLFILSRLAHFQAVLGVISLVGGLFIAYLAYGSFRSVDLNGMSGAGQPQSLVNGVAANALSPYSYLFWLTGRVYRLILIVLGVLLAGFAFSLIRAGILLLKS